MNLDPIEVGAVGADNILGQHMRSIEQAGLYSGSVLVARRGEILLRHGYGFANRTSRNTATTKFRIASLTKQFTAVLILRLQEQGKLSIDDRICSYLEFCAPQWAPITIRQLLSHSSGIPDYTDFLDFDARQATPTTREELIARFRSEPLISTPGSVYNYSNSGYILLGQILEYITGMPYADIIKNELCIPLGLNDTDYDHSKAGTDPTLSFGFYAKGVPADPIDASTLDAAGGLYSTIDDLYRWDRALHGGQVLKPETLALMRTPQLKNYALGVMRNPLAGMASVHHDGMASGMRTYLGNFPDPDITVVVLSNYENADVVNIAAYLGVLARGMP
jgi:CubicO group peptidase (beta-lactamase class C family)